MSATRLWSTGVCAREEKLILRETDAGKGKPDLKERWKGPQKDRIGRGHLLNPDLSYWNFRRRLI